MVYMYRVRSYYLARRAPTLFALLGRMSGLSGFGYDPSAAALVLTSIVGPHYESAYGGLGCVSGT